MTKSVGEWTLQFLSSIFQIHEKRGLIGREKLGVKFCDIGGKTQKTIFI